MHLKVIIRRFWKKTCQGLLTNGNSLSYRFFSRKLNYYNRKFSWYHMNKNLTAFGKWRTVQFTKLVIGMKNFFRFKKLLSCMMLNLTFEILIFNSSQKKIENLLRLYSFPVLHGTTSSSKTSNYSQFSRLTFFS